MGAFRCHCGKKAKWFIRQSVADENGEARATFSGKAYAACGTHLNFALASVTKDQSKDTLFRISNVERA